MQPAGRTFDTPGLNELTFTKVNFADSFCCDLFCPTGIGGINGGLGASLANGSAASSMDALTQAYSGMQQYTASALPSLYGQSLLQQSVAGSQKEGEQFPSLLLHL